MTEITNKFDDLKVDVEKTSEALDKLLQIFQENKFTVSELVVLYSNLGYSLGASIEGIKEGISIEELNKKYYTEPTIGVSLMLQSLVISSWLVGIKE